MSGHILCQPAEKKTKRDKKKDEKYIFNTYINGYTIITLNNFQFLSN